VEPIDLCLEPDVRPRLELKVSSFRRVGVLPLHRAFDLSRGGVVSFDQVGIVTIHDSHEFGQAGSCPGMKTLLQVLGGGHK
jgi:hypothetical protein